MTPEQIEELERLSNEAFCAPWTYHSFEIACEDHGDDHECVTVEAPDEYPDGQCICQQTIVVPGLEMFAKRNGELIVAMRNALPELLAMARELERLKLPRTVSGQAAENAELKRNLLATRRALAKAREILTVVEWTEDEDEHGDAHCPSCGSSLESGHDNGCELRALLARPTERTE